MKDFDESRSPLEADARTFKIGGQQFVAMPYVDLDYWAVFWDARDNVLDKTNVEYVAMLHAHVRGALEPESAAKWDRAAKTAKPPIMLVHLNEVIDFLWEVQSGRPFQKPSDSTDSRNGSGTESTPTSPTPEAVSSTV